MRKDECLTGSEQKRRVDKTRRSRDEDCESCCQGI